MVHLSKASVYEWQLEQEFRAKIEELVMMNCIWSVEGNMWDCFYSAKNVNLHGRKKEISSIRDELDAISKSLSVCDNGQLSSEGSLEVEEESGNGNKGAGSHPKVLNNLKSSSSLPSTITTATTSSPSASSSSSLCEENGIHDELETNMEEDLDPALLKHMKKEELISHCKSKITKLKRNHELEVQDLTEQHFGHMRELLRERTFSLTLKKNKEFDMLRKRISEVVSKVDEILVEKEEVATLLPHTFGSNEESLSSLKGRVESLLSENHQLRDLLEDKNGQIKCLSLQVSEAAKNRSQHSLAEAKLLKTVGNVKAAMEDAHIEALIGEDLFSGIVREVVDEIKCIAEESQVENSTKHEIYKSKFKEASHEAELATKLELEDLDTESIITQEVCGVIFKDALKNAEEKLNELNIKYIEEYEHRVLQEMDKREKEKQLEVEVANKVRLQQEVHFLVEEKEQLARDAAAALEIEKERYELAAQEVENLRGETCQHQKLISESVEESNAAKRDLVEALEQNERHRADICVLEQKLEAVRGETFQHQKLISESVEESNAAKHDLVEALEQNERYRADICVLEQKLGAAVKELRQAEEDFYQQKQIAVSLFEAKERELSEKFESIAVYIRELLKAFTDFECRVTRDISEKCSRLKSLTSQSHLLKQKADVLVRRGLLYKQRLEKKCSDLQKAETEINSPHTPTYSSITSPTPNPILPPSSDDPLPLPPTVVLSISSYLERLRLKRSVIETVVNENLEFQTHSKRPRHSARIAPPAQSSHPTAFPPQQEELGDPPVPIRQAEHGVPPTPLVRRTRRPRQPGCSRASTSAPRAQGGRGRGSRARQATVTVTTPETVVAGIEVASIEDLLATQLQLSEIIQALPISFPSSGV